jgi:maltose-binding protein MalE
VAAIERARVARQVVPNKHAYDDPAIGGDATISAFRAQLAHTTTLPKTPAMRTVWTPYETALGEVLAGRISAADQLVKLEQEVRSYQRVEK